MENFTERTAPAGLYDSRFEHDNCGIGAVVDIKGRCNKPSALMWSISPLII